MSESHEAADPSPDWARVQPLVDEVLQRLDSRDRDAILLRYFEQRPFPEIASRLELKEDAARMRVNRALARMRELLASRGIRSTEAALGALLVSDAAAGAVMPAALTGTIIQAAFAAGPASATSLAWLPFMTANKALLVAVLVAALTGGICTNWVFQRSIDRDRAALNSLQSENEQLRNRLAVAMLANQKGDAALDAHTATRPTGGTDSHLSSVLDKVKIREAASDALPTQVAHPLKYRGFETPISAVESFMWASYHSDADAIARCLYLDDAARAATEKIRTALTPEMQAQYPTAESLLGMCIAYDVIDHPGPNTEDILIGAPEPNYVDSDDFKTPNGSIYHRTAEGWKYSFPAKAVAGFVNNVLSPKAP